MADVPADIPAPARSRALQGWRLRLGDIIVSVVCCGLGTFVGFWWLPFAVGILVGARRPRSTVLPAVAGAVAGWAIALWILALRGLPVGGTARAIAALAGLPPYAAVTVAVTLLLAALQVLVGAWLARAVLPARAVIAKGE